MSNHNAPLAAAAAATGTTILLGMAWLANLDYFRRPKTIIDDADSDNSLPSVIMSDEDEEGSSSYRNNNKSSGNSNYDDDDDDSPDLSVLPCILERRSVFPNAFARDAPPVEERVVRSLLDAALHGPFHGKCYAGNRHPAKFVVLGRRSTIEMQRLTLDYYDAHWAEHWPNRGAYESFRVRTEGEISGRWGPVSYMIAIVMRRRSGPRLLPEWEEAAAVACAVQNMHLQSTKFRGLACYWSSWHDAARDSAEMGEFLGMDHGEDRCMGFFVVASAKNPDFRAKRRRDPSLLSVEWRD